MVGGARHPGNLVDPFMRGGKMGANGATSSSDERRASPTPVPVYLNVYDLTPMNGYVYWFGLGIFHSGIEAHGLEYGFGAHDYPSSGVFEVEPRNCPGFTFRRSIVMGTTDMTPQEFRSFIEECADDYRGNSYHLITKNCNHFTNDVCLRLTSREIPGWVNRLAGIGSFCNCLLPESLQVAVVNQTERIESSERFEIPKQEATRRSLASLFGSENSGSKMPEGESSLFLLAQLDGDAKALRRERH